MQTHPKNFSFVVFPFLKTGGTVSIGEFLFRPTDDTDRLSAEQAACVGEIASMLFLQNDLRIRSATYAVIPHTDLGYPPRDAEKLIRVQAVVAYLYASPRHEFGDLFLSSEHASMAIFTPGKVLSSLVSPRHYVETMGSAPDLEPDNLAEIEGYAGLYNFRHSFWVAKGSRLYGPKPHITLNLSQDLSLDLPHAVETRVDHRLLNELLGKSDTESSSRIFTAVQWFNAANNEANDDAVAIVDLSIAFESLLSLPRDEKTERLTDAISLLLGRTARLDSWARQFYDARSRIVHEGRAHQLRFVATDSQKANEGPLYQSLLSYGRQVFQLCLATLLVGADIAKRAGLEEKLVTNQERFLKICKVLSDPTYQAQERLERIAPIVVAIQQYRYVPEDNLRIETMLGAIRLAAKTLLDNGKIMEQEFKEYLEQVVLANKAKDHLPELDALYPLANMASHSVLTGDGSSETFLNLADAVWHYVFMHYFWMKERQSKPGELT